MMRAVIYARVSAKKSLKGESLEQQLADCEAYAVRHNMHIVASYTDRARTGRNDDRPEFQRLRADAAQKQFDVVLVWKLDRCARNTWLQLKVVDDFLQSGIRIYSTTEQIEYETAAGRYMLTILAGSAEMVSNLLSERMKRTFAYRAEHGRWVGPVPVGYQRDPETRILTQTDDALAVQMAYELYASGQHSYSSVADILNSRGYRIPNVQTGGRNLYNKFSIRELLNNPAYIGKTRHKDQVYDGLHAPLIDEQTWQAVQDILARHRAKAGQVSLQSGNGILTELVFCELCGARMWHHNKVKYPYYVCSSRYRRICEAPMVPAKKTEAQIFEMLAALAIPADWQRQILLIMQDLHAKRQATVQPTVNTAEIMQRLTRLQHLYLEGDIGEEQYRTEKAKAQALLGQEPALVVRREMDMRKALQKLTSIHDIVQRSPITKQRAILRELFVSFWISKLNEIVAITPREPYLALVSAIATMNLSVNGEPGGQSSHLLWKIPPIWTQYNQPYRYQSI